MGGVGVLLVDLICFISCYKYIRVDIANNYAF